MDEVGGLPTVAIEEVLRGLKLGGLVHTVGGQVSDGHDGLSGSTFEHLGDVIVELVVDDGGDQLLEPRLAIQKPDLLLGVTGFKGHSLDLGSRSQHVSCSPVPGFFFLDLNRGLSGVRIGVPGRGTPWRQDVLDRKGRFVLLKRWRAVQCADVKKHLGFEGFVEAGVGKRRLPIISSRNPGRRRWWAGRVPGWPWSGWQEFSSERVSQAGGNASGLAGFEIPKRLKGRMVDLPRVRGGYNMNLSTP